MGVRGLRMWRSASSAASTAASSTPMAPPPPEPLAAFDSAAGGVPEAGAEGAAAMVSVFWVATAPPLGATLWQTRPKVKLPAGPDSVNEPLD